jgi:oligopeptide/dipeptide ABC transporter ATP-binding protein
MANRLLEVIDLRTSFFDRDRVTRAVDGVSFYVNEGETLSLVGESGCGKSMTCLSILRVLPPGAKIIGGKIIFKGRDILAINDEEMRKLRGRDISLILQDPMASLDPLFSIHDQIGEAFNAHFRLKKRELVPKVINALKVVQIAAPEKRVKDFPHQFSGGMQQRIVGAIAMSCQPSLLIADEPTTSLDVTTQMQYLELLRSLQKDFGVAIIFITHDFGIVAAMSHRIAVMYAGKIVESASTRDIFHHPAHRYTSALLKSVPRLEVETARLNLIPGQPPKLDRQFIGCRFAHRCTYCDDKCTSEEPQLVQMGDNHYVACWHPE